MTSWVISESGKGFSVHDKTGALVAADVSEENAASILAAAARLISEETANLVPLSNDGNYVFFDGPGDVEIDHQGIMRRALEKIAGQSSGAAATAYHALRDTGPGFAAQEELSFEGMSAPEVLGIIRDARLYLGGCSPNETAGGMKNSALRDRIDAAFPQLLDGAQP